MSTSRRIWGLALCPNQRSLSRARARTLSYPPPSLTLALALSHSSSFSLFCSATCIEEASLIPADPEIEVVLRVLEIGHHRLFGVEELHEVKLHVVLKEVLHDFGHQERRLELAQPAM